MKKLKLVVMAFALVGMVASFAGCGEDEADVKESVTSSASESKDESSETEAEAEAVGLVGQWEYESGGYIYTFNEDGTGQYDVGGTIMKLTYEDKGTILSILFEGNTDPMELEYSITDGKLVIIDSLGDEVVYNRL